MREIGNMTFSMQNAKCRISGLRRLLFWVWALPTINSALCTMHFALSITIVWRRFAPAVLENPVNKMNFKRITLFAGHYGSGKTNIAVNYAVKIKDAGIDVCVADLDIVNPYYRAKDSEDELQKRGIKLISSVYANSNVDLPAIPQDMYSIIDNKETFAVMDIGGDDRGALALGRYAPSIIEENDYEMFFVINKFRPLTPDAESTVEVMREVESAGGIKFTAIVNNSNLGEETTAEDVLSSVSYAEEISSLTGLPVKLTTVKSTLFNELSGRIENIMPLNLQHVRKYD